MDTLPYNADHANTAGKGSMAKIIAENLNRTTMLRLIKMKDSKE